MVRHTALGRLFRARAPRFGSQHAAVVPDDVFAYVLSAGSAGRISANLRPFPRQILLDLVASSGLAASSSCWQDLIRGVCVHLLRARARCMHAIESRVVR
jgi:hypothetical protein